MRRTLVKGLILCKNVGMETKHDSGAFCPYFLQAIELIGRRWTGAILRALSRGTERFSALTQAIPGLSDRLLSERLKELEAEGIVRRTVLPTTPVTITYHLTAKGEALEGVMDAVSAWAQEWLVPREDESGEVTNVRDAIPAD
jgi:DNA-binding HxlR family transcriptional regulator